MAAQLKEKISPSFASFLDLARAVSAIAVFLNHLRDPLFLGYRDLAPGQQGLIVNSWFFLTGFGFASVMVFFVLSGYLVGGVGLSRVRQRSFQPLAYFVDRFSRLFVVLIPALMLTVLLDYLGQRYFGTIGFWDRTNPVIASKFSDPFLSFDGWKPLVCNAAMLQSFYCPPFGSNVPLWSLSYEFWLYMCFGAVAVAAVGRHRIVPLLCLIAIVIALGPNFVWLAAVWLFGVAAHAYRGKRFRWPWLAIPVFLIAAAAVRILGIEPPNGNAFNNIVFVVEGAAFAWVVVSMRRVEIRWLAKLRPFGGSLASFSYTLYLIHFPLMLFVIAALAAVFPHGDLSRGVAPLSRLGIGLFLTVFVVVMATAWLLAAVTEAHTHEVRAWLRRRLMRRSARMADAMDNR